MKDKPPITEYLIPKDYHKSLSLVSVSISNDVTVYDRNAHTEQIHIIKHPERNIRHNECRYSHHNRRKKMHAWRKKTLARN